MQQGGWGGTGACLGRCWEWKRAAVPELPRLHSPEVLLHDAPHSCSSTRSERAGGELRQPQLHTSFIVHGCQLVRGSCLVGAKKRGCGGGGVFPPPLKALLQIAILECEWANTSQLLCSRLKASEAAGGVGSCLPPHGTGTAARAWAVGGQLVAESSGF